MRIKDIKLLWGRSGNRCAICKIELSPDGSAETIGEIAHIVSRTKEGPRGNDVLPLAKRDDYSNLMLLCPNHHSEIDKLADSWPSSKLHQIKEDHEKWVSEQLEHGVLSFKPVDNSEYLEPLAETSICIRNNYCIRLLCPYLELFGQLFLNSTKFCRFQRILIP